MRQNMIAEFFIFYETYLKPFVTICLDMYQTGHRKGFTLKKRRNEQINEHIKL